MNDVTVISSEEIAAADINRVRRVMTKTCKPRWVRIGEDGAAFEQWEIDGRRYRIITRLVGQNNPREKGSGLTVPTFILQEIAYDDAHVFEGMPVPPVKPRAL